MSSSLHQTPLHSWHQSQGAKLVDFAGWSMPVYYTSITEEHLATRTACGIFDVSHMGRLSFAGPAAETFLEGLLTRRVSTLRPGDVRYAMITNDAGGVLDDVLVSRFPESDRYGLVVNASNREKLLNWIRPRLGKYDLQFEDETFETAMLAIQGPLAIAIVSSAIDEFTPDDLNYYQVGYGKWNATPVTVSRTGYTGEDGVELTIPGGVAFDLWTELQTAMETQGGRAVGLGARDTLRLEAGMPLYGHELSESLTPFDVGLGFAVQLKDRVFPGHEALRSAKAGSPKSRIGLTLEGKRVPREEYKVYGKDDLLIGTISSGTFSPTLSKPIAMAIVESDTAAVGEQVHVDIRGKQIPANVVDLPFYVRS